MEPTPIKLPKVEKGMYSLRINVKDLYGIKNEYVTVTLKRQEIGGFKIPQGTTLRVNSGYVNTHSRTVILDEKVINNLLKTLYLDTLRTIKK